MNRRALLGGGAGVLALAGCGNGVGAGGAALIDARVQATQSFLQQNYASARDLQARAVGQLVMPLITEAGFFAGGAYGRGALVVNGVTVDYYSATQASFGLQIGAQQYAHVLYFMTEEALQEFRTSPGWEAGADVEYALNDRGANAGATSTTLLTPVIGIVFGQQGLLAGASIEGTKYTRIIP
ncbi:Las17-binding protein actin regulator [Hasllibacter halocynthiae]|uniref:Las17-binding protein actin regulator n=2 Tax=Hasllibacter halocynthiae TaxID=595589 RepID=A0A2T0X8A1_9RHOB|nr:Las17-binding protein actin regulator [Hasllibacter halocynthiae]